MIPQEKISPVTRGVCEAFGVTSYDDIHLLSQGSFNRVLVFRIVVRGSPYLLRIIMRSDDPTDHFTCMKAAADAGLAPRVWYVSVEDKLSITDFVQKVTFPEADAVVRMPALLRRVHALPPFPSRAPHLNTSCTFLMNKGPALDGFLDRFRSANLLTEVENQELFARYRQLAEAYLKLDPQPVASHNDLKAANILFDGSQAWLVDWEAAFLNDRYADLAVLANLFDTTELEEAAYLERYFGQPPDSYQLARFYLMRQVAHMFHGMAYLFLGSPPGEYDGPRELGAIHRRIWAGEFEVEDRRDKAVYGRAHLEQLFENVRQPRYLESLKITSGRF